jgi:hypothetical protein
VRVTTASGELMPDRERDAENPQSTEEQLSQGLGWRPAGGCRG